MQLSSITSILDRNSW